MIGINTILLFTIFIGGVFGVLILILYRMFIKMLWPVSTPIAVQRGDSVVWDLDERAKYVKNKEGYEVLKLRKRKHNIKPPKFQHVTITQGGKPVYPLFNTVSGQYFPIKMMNSPRFEVIEDPSAKNWLTLETQRLRRAYSEKESTLMKFMPYIMSGIFAAMIIFFVIYFGGKMEAVGNSLSGASNSLSDALLVWSGNAPAPTHNTTSITVVP
jgi:hypothetical protein